MNIRKLEIQTLVNGETYEPTDDDWLVYGHSDILKTHIIDGINDDPKGIKAIYEDGLKFKESFHQVFYLLIDQDDRQFFKDAQNAYFCSVFFITLSNRLTAHSKKYVFNHDSIKRNNNMKIYRTVDNYDAVIITYGDNIAEIEQMVDNYLYSISQKDESLKIRDIYKMYISSFKKINSSPLPLNILSYSAQIQIILQDGNGLSCDRIKKELCKNHKINAEVFYTNGSKNIFILIHNISIESLFSLYNTQNKGLFAVNSDLRKEKIRSTNLKFLFNIEMHLSYIQQTQYKNLSENFNNEIHDLLVSSSNYIDEFYKMQLERIIFSLKYILLHDLPDYSFLTLFYPIKKFLLKLDQIATNHPTEMEQCVRLFIEACINNLDISDSTQFGHYPVQTYIGKELLTPSELIAFYTAFLWQFHETIIGIENASSKEKPDFVFCLTPSMENSVSIIGLFLFDELINDRLLLVKIPLKFFYDPKIMIFSLAHEGSHYIGEKVRCRETRRKYIIESFLHYFLDNLLDSIDESLVQKYKIDEKLTHQFVAYVDIHTANTKLPYYSVNLRRIICVSCQSVLVDILFKVQSIIDITPEYESDKIEEYANDMYTIISKLKFNSKTLLLDEDYYQVIDNIFEVFSESYADLFAILILRTNCEFYLKCITESYGVKQVYEIDDTFVLMRIISNFIVNEFDDKYLLGKSKELRDRYMKYKETEYGSPSRSLSKTFNNPAILENLILYLQYCRDKYNHLYKDLYENLFEEGKFNQLVDGIFDKDISLDIIMQYNNKFRSEIISALEK